MAGWEPGHPPRDGASEHQADGNGGWFVIDGGPVKPGRALLRALSSQAGGPRMLRTTVLSAVAAIALPLALSASAMAVPDSMAKLPKNPAVAATAQPAAPGIIQVADATRPKQAPIAAKDVILYNIISDQISEMRRKSALPTTMCIAESNSDGTAETVSRTLMAQLEADNAQIDDTLFTIKHATECENAGQRM